MFELFKLAFHDHPLIASLLGFLFLLIIPLGSMHVLRIFGRFFVVTIGEFKHECAGIRKVVRDVRHELRTWNVDD